MPVYALFHRVFPVSYTAKLLIAVWLGIGAAVGVAWTLGAAAWPLAAVGALGGVIASALLTGLLSPLRRIELTLSQWGRTGRVLTLPDHFTDDMGLLMLHTNLLLARAQRTLDSSWTAADVDPLTGTLNVDGAERLLADAGAGWLIGIAIGGFDDLAGRRGSAAAAEEVLAHVAHVCTQTVRQDDMVARTGEARFLVYLPGASREVAGRIADRIDTRLDLGHADLTACYGVAVYPGGGDVTAAWMEVGKALDAALARLPGGAGMSAA